MAHNDLLINRQIELNAIFVSHLPRFGSIFSLSSSPLARAESTHNLELRKTVATRCYELLFPHAAAYKATGSHLRHSIIQKSVHTCPLSSSSELLVISVVLPSSRYCKRSQTLSTALVRNEAHIAPLSKLGVTCVKGTNQDTSLVTELASKTDIIFNAADADDLQLFNAILDGCKQRLAATSVMSVYIHTSGTAVFSDGAEGVFNPSSLTYDDKNVEMIGSIAPNAIHREVEQSVVNADVLGQISAFIVSPSAVYGRSPSPIPRAVLLVKLLIQIGGGLKALPYVGDGSNVLPLIYINDMAAAYVAIVKLALSGKDTESGYGRYYIVTGSQATWKEVIGAYGPPLEEKGIIDTTEPTLVTVDKVPIMKFIGGNTLVKAGKLLDMGWAPNSPFLFEELGRDVEFALAA